MENSGSQFMTPRQGIALGYTQTAVSGAMLSTLRASSSEATSARSQCFRSASPGGRRRAESIDGPGSARRIPRERSSGARWIRCCEGSARRGWHTVLPRAGTVQTRNAPVQPHRRWTLAAAFRCCRHTAEAIEQRRPEPDQPDGVARRSGGESVLVWLQRHGFGAPHQPGGKHFRNLLAGVTEGDQIDVIPR